MDKPKVIVICGPTASGKTALSIELAKKINGEIISSDSMQIYKDMNIGTAKPTQEEMQGIQHYLLDFVEPNQRYSVAEYKKDAENAQMVLEEFPYLSPNTKAVEAMGKDYSKNEAKNPPAEVIKKGEYVKNLDADTLKIYDEMWTKLKQ